MIYFYTTVLCELKKHIFKAKHLRYFNIKSIVWLKEKFVFKMSWAQFQMS